ISEGVRVEVERSPDEPHGGVEEIREVQHLFLRAGPDGEVNAHAQIDGIGQQQQHTQRRERAEQRLAPPRRDEVGYEGSERGHRADAPPYPNARHSRRSATNAAIPAKAHRITRVFTRAAVHTPRRAVSTAGTASHTACPTSTYPSAVGGVPAPSP